MINILRVGNHPTDFYNTVAYHAYWLNANPNFNTIHISPDIKGKPLTPKGKTKVIRYKFLNKPRPKKSNIIVRSVFTLHRVLRIITFSLNSIRHLKNQDVVHIHSPMYMIVGFVAKFFGKKVYKTVIPRNVRVSEAPSFGKPVLIYDSKCKGSKAYLGLAKEFLKQEKNLMKKN